MIYSLLGMCLVHILSSMNILFSIPFFSLFFSDLMIEGKKEI